MIYLRLGVDRVEEVAVVAVPDPDAPVGGAAARGEHARLPRAPRHRLHCSLRRKGTELRGVPVRSDIHSITHSWLSERI